MEENTARQIWFELRRIAHALEAIAKHLDSNFQTKREEGQAKQDWSKQQG